MSVTGAQLGSFAATQVRTGSSCAQLRDSSIRKKVHTEVTSRWQLTIEMGGSFRSEVRASREEMLYNCISSARFLLYCTIVQVHVLY